MTPQRKMLDELISSLDDQQKHVAAWTPVDGNMRVVAAAGSGKTRSLVALSAQLVCNEVVPPSSIILTTFSRKAADEMRTRLAKVVPQNLLQQMRVGTFHSLGLAALRQTNPKFWNMDRCVDTDSRAAGVPSSYELWRAICSYGKVPGTQAESLRLPEAPSYYSGRIDLWRSQGYESFGEVPPPIGMTHHEKETFRQAWSMYSAAKETLSVWDFADVLHQWKTALAEGKIPAQNSIVLVDEAQDNNIVQAKIAQLLAQDEGRIVLIGDLRQCVHTWRGAYPDLFATSDVNLKAHTREITTNYRSEAPIVALSNYIASGKAWNLGSMAKPARNSEHARHAIEVLQGAYGPDEEAEAVARRIADDVAAGSSPGDYAILCRTNAGRALFEAALTRFQVPLVVIGGSSVFRTREAESVLAYSALSEYNAVGSLDRILNTPKRYLPHSFVASVHDALTSCSDIVDAIRYAAKTAKLKPGPKRGAMDLADAIEDLRAVEWSEVPKKVEKLLKSNLTREAEDADEDRLSLITAACAIAQRFKSPLEFITFAQQCCDGTSVLAEGGKSTTCVTLSTCHSAKGLEWNHVYVSANRTMFPHKKSGNRDEENRLFYVAVTRAARKVTFSWNKLEGLTQYLPEASEFARFLGAPT